MGKLGGLKIGRAGVPRQKMLPGPPMLPGPFCSGSFFLPTEVPQRTQRYSESSRSINTKSSFLPMKTDDMVRHYTGVLDFSRCAGSRSRGMRARRNCRN